MERFARHGYRTPRTGRTERGGVKAPNGWETSGHEPSSDVRTVQPVHGQERWDFYIGAISDARSDFEAALPRGKA
jgi:hypothetical protein